MSGAVRRIESAASCREDDVIEIVLEDVAPSWWRMPLRRLGAGASHGVALLRPVGRVVSGFTEDVLGPTFPYPAARELPDDRRPEAAWSPPMATAMAELRARLVDAGWQVVGRGTHPWSERYRRPVRDRAADPEVDGPVR